MAVTTNHPNQEVDEFSSEIQTLGEFIDEDILIGLLQDVTTKLNDGSFSIPERDSLIGEGSMDEGGVVGDLLSLYSAHISSAIRGQNLTKAEAGKVYAEAIPAAGQLALAIQQQEVNASISILDAKTKIIVELLRTAQIKQDTELKLLQAKESEFRLKVLLPLEREKLKEEIASVHVKHALDTFVLSNLMPIDIQVKQATLDDIAKGVEVKEATRLSTIKNTEIADYNLTDMLPAEKNKVEKDVEIASYNLTDILPANKSKIVAETSLTNKEIDIKTYYKSFIQPEELTLTKSKAYQEFINAGQYTLEASLPYKRMLQLEEQTVLYHKQGQHYEDQKYQALLDTIMNYSAMVYPDDPDGHLLTWAVTPSNSSSIYDALKP